MFVALGAALLWVTVNLGTIVAIDYFEVTRNIVRYGGEVDMSGPRYFLHVAQRQPFPWKRLVVMALFGIPALLVVKCYELMEKHL